MPGGWIWLVILALVLGMIFLAWNSDRGTIPYSAFLRLVYEPELNKHLKKVIFIGTDRIQGEVDSSDDLPDEIKNKIRSNNQFTTSRMPFNEDRDLEEQLRKLTLRTKDSKENPGPPLTLDRQEEHLAWLGPIIMVALPAVIVSGAGLTVSTTAGEVLER